MPLFFKKKLPTIVMIHGFGSKLMTEFDPLYAYLKKLGYPIIRFNIYDIKDPEDADYKEWISRCEKQMNLAFSKSKDVVLIGFSMGGVIASYLASIYPVKMLILVAPAFYYLDSQKVGQAIIAKTMPSSKEKEGLKPSSAQTNAFQSIVSNLRESIRHVTCPILILHGSEDEVINPKSSKRSYAKIPHNRKRLIYLEGGKHRMLYDGTLEKTAFQLIRDMLEGKLL